MAQMIIVGSIGLDDISTPFGEVTSAYGGSATYAGYAASFFTKNKVQLGMVAIAGKDLPEEYFVLLRQREIDVQGVTIHGKNFRWSGKYEYDMNQAHTLKTELNALAAFQAELPQVYKNAKYILLANNPPVLQLKVLQQLENPKFIVVDSMNLWIETAREQLLEVIEKATVLVINDSEARMLFATLNLVQAAKKALDLGVHYCIIKKGEHGALLFTEQYHFNAPGYPLEIIKDPTGCGDCFAGALLGYLAATDDVSLKNIKKAMIYGSVIASFNAEEFSLRRLQTLTQDDIVKRYQEFARMREF